MSSRWTTLVVWLAFTALATAVGLAAVSVVRHAVVATSFQATNAKDITAVRDGEASAVPKATTSATPDSSPTSPVPSATVAPTVAGTGPQSVPSTTAYPTRTDTQSPAPTESGDGQSTGTPSPSPTTKGTVYVQPFSFGTVSVLCSPGGLPQYRGASGNSPYYVAEVQAASGSDPLTIHFQPTEGSDAKDETLSITCSSDGTPNYVVEQD